jgi:hypothetical protein
MKRFSGRLRRGQLIPGDEIVDELVKRLGPDELVPPAARVQR